MTRTVVTRHTFRNLIRNCRGLRVRVDRHLPGGAVQTWMRTVYLTRSPPTNRALIADAIQELRSNIRATAILA